MDKNNIIAASEAISEAISIAASEAISEAISIAASEAISIAANPSRQDLPGASDIGGKIFKKDLTSLFAEIKPPQIEPLQDRKRCSF